MEKLEEAVKSKVQDGKILCKDAFEIAAELNVNLSAIGKEFDRLKIKVKGCQLGCF